MDRFIEKRDQKLKTEAEKLINKLRQEEEEEEVEEEIEEEKEKDQEKEEKDTRKIKKGGKKEGGRNREEGGGRKGGKEEGTKGEEEEWMGRGSFKRKEEGVGKDEEKKKEKELGAEEILDRYIREETGVGMEEERGIKEKGEKENGGGDMVEDGGLLSGLNVDNLKKKYQKKELKPISKNEMEKILGGDMEIEKFDSKLAFADNVIYLETNFLHIYIYKIIKLNLNISLT